MSKNLNKLTYTANQKAAINDLMFIYNQLKALGHAPPLKWHENDSPKKIDAATRIMINWAKANDIAITLPEGWKP